MEMFQIEAGGLYGPEGRRAEHHHQQWQRNTGAQRKVWSLRY